LDRWRCHIRSCKRQTFAGQLPAIIAPPFARRTNRVSQLVRQLGHAAGGRPAELLMAPLGMPVSNDTILRHLNQHDAARSSTPRVRVTGIDDWGWLKGHRYGTLIMDLERREVVDVLSDRSAATTARWFDQHPEVEIVSRDRCGLYAQGARRGAPHRRGKWPTGFTCFRTCGKAFRSK
jgi:transposase